MYNPGTLSKPDQTNNSKNQTLSTKNIPKTHQFTDPKYPTENP
jgi:hypothetical protein